MDNDLNISDVIEVLETTDPQYSEQRSLSGPSCAMFPQAAPQQADPGKPYVRLVEQPAPKALRFRYECEGRSAGSIPGVSSSPENKSFPTIQVVGYEGRAVVVVSCVTKDLPYRPHPHNLVGKDGCKKGVCTLEMNQENMTCSFSNLGIQCVKKKDIEDALKVREEIRVDPYRTGFGHRTQPTSIDLNAVRLCFQVFLEGPEPGKFKIPLAPIVSDPIFDKKAMSDLVICRLSDVACFASGGKEIILLCEKVAKEDITVRFYQEKDGRLEWEGLADFQPTDVHKQVAIGFRTPAYKDLQIQKEVEVKVQLRRPSDGATSESRDFKYLPVDSAVNKRKQMKHTEFPPSKRSMPSSTSSGQTALDRRQRPMQPQSGGFSLAGPQGALGPANFNLPQQQCIKTEPSEPTYSLLAPSPTYQPSSSPSPQGGYLPQYSNQGAPTPGLPPMHPQASPSGQDRYSPAIPQNFLMHTQQFNPQSTSPNLMQGYIPNSSFSNQQNITQNPFLQIQDTFQFNPSIRANISPQMGNNLQQQQQQQHNPPVTDNNTFLNLDSQSLEMSGDLTNLSLGYFDPNNLSENLSGALRLCEEPGGSGQNPNRGEPSRNDIENMSTDSISKIASDAYDKIA